MKVGHGTVEDLHAEVASLRLLLRPLSPLSRPPVHPPVRHLLWAGCALSLPGMILDRDIREEPVSHRLLTQLMLLLARCGKDLLLLMRGGSRRLRRVQTLVLAA